MERLAAVIEQKLPLFNTVLAQHSLRDALYQMSCENLDYLIVQDGTEFVGILSEQDVAHKLFSRNKPLEELAVKDIMNTAIPVGSVDDDIDFSIQLLSRYKSRYIAVFDRLHFKGIVSETDLLKQSIASRQACGEAAVFQDSFHWSY
jgi:predicted transcriptional regulator